MHMAVIIKSKRSHLSGGRQVAAGDRVHGEYRGDHGGDEEDAHTRPFPLYISSGNEKHDIDKSIVSEPDHGLKGERPADEDAGSDPAPVALVEADQVLGTQRGSCQHQSGCCSTCPP